MKLALCLLFLITPSVATARPVPDAQWTKDARLWTARALVAECGWDDRTDMAGVAWVLAKRWQMHHRQFSYLRMVRSYARPLRADARRRWLRHLPIDGHARPRWWPRGLDWGQHAIKWRAVINFVDTWAAGSVPDPYPQAIHYGGRMDKRPPHFVRVGRGAGNIFYAVRKVRFRH